MLRANWERRQPISYFRPQLCFCFVRAPDHYGKWRRSNSLVTTVSYPRVLFLDKSFVHVMWLLTPDCWCASLLTLPQADHYPGWWCSLQSEKSDQWWSTVAWADAVSQWSGASGCGYCVMIFNEHLHPAQAEESKVQCFQEYLAGFRVSWSHASWFLGPS